VRVGQSVADSEKSHFLLKEESMELDTVDKILDFAIEQEEKAAAFYTELAGKAVRGGMREAFLQFAEEENGHKAKLLKIKSGKQMMPAQKRVLDLKLGDHLEEVRLSGDLNYQQALIVAMKAEKAAFRLYNDLATATDDQALKDTLLGLAQEEARHKLRFELEYDDNILQEN
jgi:rubrerythrin